MAVDGKFESIQMTAGEDLSSYEHYIVAAVDGQRAASTSEATGIVKSYAESGEQVRVGYAGKMKVVAGGTITKGARLGVTASGTAAVVTSGDASCGMSLEAVASGYPFVGIFNFAAAGEIL